MSQDAFFLEYDLVNPPEPLVVEGDDLPGQEVLHEGGDPLSLDDPGHGLGVGDDVTSLHEGEAAPATPGVQHPSLQGNIRGKLVTAKTGDMLQYS